eukprot:99353_1
MAKVRKGATVVLKLDDLYLWLRKLNKDPNSMAKSRFKIVNRAMDFNKLPPCRAKIIYMGIPKFLKQKKLIFGVQLYPPYFGLTQRVYKSPNTRKILGKIPSKELKAPKGSIWFITENDIKGVMLRNNPRRMSKGASHLGSPHISSSPITQNTEHLNMRSSSKSPREESKQNGDKPPAHMRRRKSTISMACHYKNLSSLDNISDVESMLWEDDALPSDYTLGNTKRTITTTFMDPEQRRFKLDRWLYPIFLSFEDEETTEIVCDRCQWELSQWIRDESEGVRTPTLREFYDYMISLSDNLDALLVIRHDTLDAISFAFEMMTRIKELTECVEDALEARFVLNVIDALDDDVFFASPVLQSILKYIGNDIKFLCVLKGEADESECMKILQTMDRYNEDKSVLPLIWQLIDILDADESQIETLCIHTDNLSETDAETFILGVIRALKHDLDRIVAALDCIISHSTMHNSYIYHHIHQILALCDGQSMETLVKCGIGHPLIPPCELVEHYKQNAEKAMILQLNLLSAIQIKYEQYQLFLGRYLLYCPFKTKAIEAVEYKKEQDEVEFYGQDDEDDDDEDSTALLIEVTIDIDNVDGKANKQVSIKKCLCVKNYQSLEYEPDHYYNDELSYEWQLKDYKSKVLMLNHTKCQWIPNLNNIKKINPSFSAIDENPEDLSNQLRGYLVLLPDDDGNYRFVEDLFSQWKKKNNKYREALHKMKERPLFVSMEKWKLTDNY